MMFSSRQRSTVGATVLLLAMLAPTSTSGAEPSAASPSASPDAWTELQLREQDAVALVLAADPRFAGVADWSALTRKWQATFIPYHLLESNYHVLSATGMDLAIANIPPRAPSSLIVAVTLVRDCVDPSDLSSPVVADPCGWRHTWTYRVEPGGVVTLLFDEGDPDEG
jgi:hypothetical protein